jgi:formylglycine-generating enzyme required for sulfatase activity
VHAILALALLAQNGPPRTETVPIPDTAMSLELVYVPGGTFRAGGRVVEVKPFWMSKHEVTWEVFEKFFANKKATAVDGVTRPSEPYEPPNGAMGTGRHPAVGMRWHGAMACAEWISVATGQRFRLPTEAEWEFAARAGDAGPAPAAPAEAGWFKDNSGDKNHEVGKKPANALGIHDLLGNVWEYSLEPLNPPDFGPVVRGGAWNTPAKNVAFGHRQPIVQEWYERDPNRPRSLWWLTDGPFIGFRVVRFVDPREKADQAAYVPKVEIGPLKQGKQAGGNVRTLGTIKNLGDRPLDEVELLVYHLDGKKPLLEDRKSRPSFTKAWPVLVNSYHEGPHRKPLAPGETRAFEVDCPQPFEWDGDVETMGARVVALQFSKP